MTSISPASPRLPHAAGRPAPRLARRGLARQLAGRRFRWMTLLVVLACAVNVRLGFWQLDRLATRHVTSALLAQRAAAPPVALTAETLPAGADGNRLLFRPVLVRGRFDYAAEMGLTDQVWNGELGLDLVTPLVLAGSDRAVLVDRGWIPVASAAPEQWAQYRAPAAATGEAPAAGATDLVEIAGWLKPNVAARGASRVPAADRLIPDLDVPRLQTRLPYALLPVIVVQASEPATGGPQSLPYRKPPVTDLGDGVHLVVALQWFALAFIIGAGYLAWVSQHPDTPSPSRSLPEPSALRAERQRACALRDGALRRG